MKPRSYKEIIDSTFKDFLSKTSIEDISAGSAMDALSKAIEAGMFDNPYPRHEQGLRRMLGKLGIKSAREKYPGLYGGAPLQMEGLDATLRNATFDDTHLKRWKTDGGK